MNKKSLLLFLLITLLCFQSLGFAAPENVCTEVKTFNVGGVNKSVNVVTVDLNSSHMELEVVTANNGVSGAESFQSMINRKKPIVAINANFFDAYKSLEPYGSIMKDKGFTYLEGENTSLMISNKNILNMDRFKSTITGSLNGKKENAWNNSTGKMDFNLFTIWYVNRLAADSTGVYLYTPDRGGNISLNGGTVIEVVEGKIIKITKNPQQSTIPPNGYLIYYGKDAETDAYISDRFKVGIPVALSYNYHSLSEKPEAASPLVSNLSAKNTKLFGSLDKNTKNNWNNTSQKMDFNIFEIWYINTNPIDSTGVYLYTPEKGSTIQVPVGKAITVQNKIITKIDLQASSVSIPKDGFVIYYGNDAAADDYISDRFALGKTVDFYNKDSLKLDTDNIIKNAVSGNQAALANGPITNLLASGIDLNKVDHMISAGPFLVNNGQIITDYVAQGYKESKITTGAAQRSAVGLTKDNKLILVTGSGLTMNQLAQIMKNLNCEKGMNLDGGASSALYAKGKIITKPGRNLNTVLMIYDKVK